MNKIENCVFNAYVNTKQWLKGTLIRAISTAAEVFCALLILIVLGEISWRSVGLVVLIAFALTIIRCLWGIPEVKPDYSAPPKTTESNGELGDAINQSLASATGLVSELIKLASAVKDVDISDAKNKDAGEDDEEDEDDE